MTRYELLEAAQKFYAIHKDCVINDIPVKEYLEIGLQALSQDLCVQKVRNQMVDIIRCKDCKHFQKWRYNPEVIKEYGQLYDCGLLILTCPSPDDYCSKAERKEEESDGSSQH